MNQPPPDENQRLIIRVLLFLLVLAFIANIAAQIFHFEYRDSLMILSFVFSALGTVILSYYKPHPPEVERILLIEDSPFWIRIVRLSLETEPTRYEVKAVETAEEALRFLRLSDSLPDQIILDLSLPGMSGEDFLEQIANDPNLHHIPITILSATSPRDDIELKMASSWITKVEGAGQLRRALEIGKMLKKLEGAPAPPSVVARLKDITSKLSGKKLLIAIAGGAAVATIAGIASHLY